MVRLANAVPVLDRKLLRDLWEMKGQSLAIAAVIGAGVAMFVTYLSNFDSLRRTRDAYYEACTVRRRVRVGQARARQPRAAHRGNPRGRGGRDSRRRGCHPRCARTGGAGSRPVNFAARAWTASAQ